MAQRDKDEVEGETVKPKMASLGFFFFFFNFFFKAKSSIGQNPHLGRKLARMAEMTENRLKSNSRRNEINNIVSNIALYILIVCLETAYLA